MKTLQSLFIISVIFTLHWLSRSTVEGRSQSKRFLQAPQGLKNKHPLNKLRNSIISKSSKSPFTNPRKTISNSDKTSKIKPVNRRLKKDKGSKILDKQSLSKKKNSRGHSKRRKPNKNETFKKRPNQRKHSKKKPKAPITANVLKDEATKAKHNLNTNLKFIKSINNRLVSVTSESSCGKTITLQEGEVHFHFIPGGNKKKRCRLIFNTVPGNELDVTCDLYLNSLGCKYERLLLIDPPTSFKFQVCDAGTYTMPVLSTQTKIKYQRRNLPLDNISGGGYCMISAVPAAGGEDPVDGGQDNVNDFTAASCECGDSPSISTNTRIVGGQQASPNEYPWQVLVLPDFNGISTSCGGSLISSKYVLTAAHCTELSLFFMSIEATSIEVKLGIYDISNPSADVISQTISSDHIIQHPDYVYSEYDNDIALLVLNSEVTFTPAIKPVCLATVQDTPTSGPSIVIGWGTVGFGDTSPVDILREVTVDIISNDRCLELYPTVTSTMLCTLTPGKDSCQGDSGGPLLVQLSSGKWAQVGVVSHGEGCAEVDKPGVYTRVSEYVTWILENTNNLGSCVT